ncbi:MAG: hypothetical protein DMF56_25210 [Acidobacteria bacterium]|nr:MAG: hypothetical protein DMF56_25210 [Acidobacteriota bacterium]
MTIVNPQITDAMAPQVNAREAIENALARAAADAVTAQQQFYVLAQAATTQSVAAMLSLDTSATAAEVKAGVDKAAAAVMLHARAASDETASSHGDEVAYLSGIAREMNALGEAFCRNLMRVVQIAATSACLTAAIARPDQFDSYRPILEAINNLV